MLECLKFPATDDSKADVLLLVTKWLEPKGVGRCLMVIDNLATIYETNCKRLTSMDLWVALDTCATCHEPLLSKYDPGFPPTLFTPLLLLKKCHFTSCSSYPNSNSNPIMITDP